MKKLLLVSLFLIGPFVFAQEWHNDLSVAINKAEVSGKMVLLLFSVPEACDACDRLEKNVIKSNAFAKFASENYILARPNFAETAPFETKADNLLIVEKYNKDGFFPWVVILDGNSRILGKMGQYNDESPEEYIAKLQSIINK